MPSRSCRVAAPLLALALAACPGPKLEDGSLQVAVSALGGGAAKLFVLITPELGAPLPMVEATGVADAFNMQQVLPPGRYKVQAWAYSEEQVAADPTIHPPAPAKYETRPEKWFIVVPGQPTFVRLVLTEADRATLGHAPYSDFISVVAPAVIFPGDPVAITATAFDPDGDLATWSVSSPGAGTFAPPASGTFPPGVEASYSVTWTPAEAGVFAIFLTVTDAAGSASVVSVTIVVSAPEPAAFLVEIDAAPVIVAPLATSDGQISAGEVTSLWSDLYDPAAEPMTVAWSNDCGGVFEAEAFGAVAGGQTTYRAAADLRVPTAPESGTCYVTLTIADASGSEVTQTLGIAVGDPYVGPPVVAP